MMFRSCLFLIAVLCGLASCEKAEDPIALPAKGPADADSVEMGLNYEKQVYYDFETGRAVFAANIDDWDLAFEASPDGKHIFLNGGRGVFVYNTRQTDMQKAVMPAGLTEAKDTGWQYDHPNGLSSGTAIGAWYANGATKGEVYIVRLNSGLQKMRILAGDDKGYTIEWMPLAGAGNPTQLQIAKDSACNYVYFSFAKGVTRIEPPSKTSWDVVFVHYRELVYESTVNRALPYSVTGALLNPYQTAAAADSVTAFAALDLAKAQTLPLSNARNTIGYDWKSFGLGTTFIYTVNSRKNYILSTQEGSLFKLRFLDFYREKGAPIFEYQRLK